MAKVKIIAAIIILFVSLGVLVYLGRVPNYPSDESVKKHIDALQMQFKRAGITEHDDLGRIFITQRYILELAPILWRYEGHVWGIDEMAKMGRGSCYDRSRAIETLFANLGYQTRHVYVIRKTFIPSWRNLFIRKVQSHAISEVKVSGHWLLVDTNSLWKAIDAQGHTYSVHQLQLGNVHLLGEPKIFEKPYIVIYGLSSRHGNFYPPYVPVPEIKWSQFLSGLLEKD